MVSPTKLQQSQGFPRPRHMQKAPKLETLKLKGLKLEHLPTVGRRALGGSYDV